jgi:hypothetical protein
VNLLVGGEPVAFGDLVFVLQHVGTLTHGNYGATESQNGRPATLCSARILVGPTAAFANDAPAQPDTPDATPDRAG